LGIYCIFREDRGGDKEKSNAPTRQTALYLEEALPGKEYCFLQKGKYSSFIKTMQTKHKSKRKYNFRKNIQKE